MEFDCEDWDIGKEASGLASSLFQEVKRKNNRKRKNEQTNEVANIEASVEDPDVVNKKLKKTVPTKVGQTDLSDGQLGGEKLSKKERKNLRRKKSKLQRKLMKIVSGDTVDTVDGKSPMKKKKESQLDVESSSNANDVMVKKKPKRNKRGKEKNDGIIKGETQSNNIAGENVAKGKKRKLNKEADNTMVVKKGKDDASSPTDSVGASLINDSTDNNQNIQSDSPSKKKKRKRISKKNKFKGYVKPEPKENLSSTSLSISPDKSSTANSKPDESSSKTENVPSSSKTEENMTESPKVGKKNKKLKKTSSVDTSISHDKQVTVSKSDGKGGADTVGKINKRNSLDPKVLGSILSPKTTEKQDSPKTSTGEKSDKVSGKTEVGKRLTGQSFLEKSKERLNAARFRYLNEQLYTTTGKEAFQLFKYDKTAFDVYHEGFQSQVEKWPSNPIDIIIKLMQSKPKHLILADFGCGDAKLARSVHQKVHSFDLVALNEHVTVCDMTKVPLKDGIVDIAVFCLSLMGTNLTSYLKEANRVLKSNATLIIAEVTSRFQSLGNFIMKIEKMGFKVKHQNSDNKMFVMVEFRKTFDCKNKDVEEIKLKPCVYKKR